jgi:hypothetical protein
MGINEGLTRSEYLMTALRTTGTQMLLELELLRASIRAMDKENSHKMIGLTMALAKKEA